MKDHLVMHINVKQFPCPDCPICFKSKKALQRHSVRHCDKKVVCDTCGANFFSTSEYKSHASVHSNERKYVCDTCGLAFNHSTSLSRHKKVHVIREERQQYLCHLCTTVFHRKDNITRHLKQVHGRSHVSDDLKQNSKKWYSNKRIRTAGRTTKLWSDPLKTSGYCQGKSSSTSSL